MITLVIWGGEFGRLPIAQKGAKPGPRSQPARLHLLDGRRRREGGHAATARPTRFGHKAAVNRVSVNDLHATILHLLGLDHEKLTFRYNGRDFRLTDVAGKVIREIIA